ncbi:hypothetical protein MYU51_007925 [Penicillium brevicompactum]
MAMAWVRPEDGILIANLLLTVLLAIGSAVVVATSITTTAIRLYVMSLMMPAVSMIKKVKQNIKMRIRAKIQAIKMRIRAKVQAKVQAVKRTRIWKFMTRVWRFLQTTLLKIGRLILLILVAIEDRTRLFSNLLAKYMKMHKRLLISYRLMKFRWWGLLTGSL